MRVTKVVVTVEFDDGSGFTQVAESPSPQGDNPFFLGLAFSEGLLRTSSAIVKGITAVYGTQKGLVSP